MYIYIDRYIGILRAYKKELLIAPVLNKVEINNHHNFFSNCHFYVRGAPPQGVDTRRISQLPPELLKKKKKKKERQMKRTHDDRHFL